MERGQAIFISPGTPANSINVHMIEGGGHKWNRCPNMNVYKYFEIIAQYYQYQICSIQPGEQLNTHVLHLLSLKPYPAYIYSVSAVHIIVIAP